MPIVQWAGLCIKQVFKEESVLGNNKHYHTGVGRGKEGVLEALKFNTYYLNDPYALFRGHSNNT